MKIVVNGIAASTGGALTIIESFYEYARKSPSNIKWIFLLNDHHIEETENISVIIRSDVKKNWFNRLYFEKISGASYINNLNPDKYISFQNTMFEKIKAKKILYLHQPIPFQKEKKFSFFNKNELKLAVYQNFIGKLIKKSITYSDKVIVQTEWLKKAIIEENLIDEERVLKLAPSIKMDNISNLNYSYKNNKNKICLFYPAANYSYKNHDIIYRVCNSIAQQEEYNEKFEILLTLDDGPKTPGIKYIGALPYEKVLQKYSESVLLFPSYIETYGLPLMEARLSKSIILASDTPFSNEILSDYKNAYFFNPFNELELEKLIKQLIDNEILYIDDDNISISENNSSDWGQLLE